MRRTHYCGALRREHMGQAAVCCGWVQTRRDMGGVIFLDVKDREGVLQVVCDGGACPRRTSAGGNIAHAVRGAGGGAHRPPG